MSSDGVNFRDVSNVGVNNAFLNLIIVALTLLPIPFAFLALLELFSKRYFKHALTTYIVNAKHIYCENACFPV